MAESFSDHDWQVVQAFADQHAADFGLPERRDDSVVLASFNIRKLGKIENKSDGAWAFLARFCERCDLIAIQEVQDDLTALTHLKTLLGDNYGMAASDITGVVAGKQSMVERLACLFRWDRIERSEVAADITIDRSAVLDTLYSKRVDFRAAFQTRIAELDEWQTKVDAKLAPWHTAVAAWVAAGKPGKKPRKPSSPKKPPFVLPHFLTFIRTPHCVSFRIKGAAGVEPYEFLAINAHLLYGHKSKQRKEREMEFYGLIHWLVERARAADRLYHKNMILLGDLNLDFTRVDTRRGDIERELKRLNGGDLKGKGRATVYFPFIDIHPSRQHIAPPKEAIFRSTARRTETYDQIAIFSHDARLPRPDIKATAGATPGGFDYGVFNFSDLFAQALHGVPFKQLDKPTRTSFIKRFEHDVSDHMPIWLRLPKPS